MPAMQQISRVLEELQLLDTREAVITSQTIYTSSLVGLDRQKLSRVLNRGLFQSYLEMPEIEPIMFHI